MDSMLEIFESVSFRDNVPGKGWDGILEITSLFSRAAGHEKGVKRDDFGLLDVKKRMVNRRDVDISKNEYR